MTQTGINQEAPTMSTPEFTNASQDVELTDDEALQATEDGTLYIDREAGECGCGCRDKVNPKRRFKMGHDQRLMGMLAEAHRNSMAVAVTTGGFMVGQSPEQAGELLGLSESGMAKLRGYMDKTADRKVKAPKTEKAPVTVAEQPEAGLGASVKIKVGRWTYDGYVLGMNQAGKVTTVEYHTSKGRQVAPEGKFTLI
jgi:hypothetical protein